MAGGGPRALRTDLGTAVRAGEVVLRDETLGFDACVIATGAAPINEPHHQQHQQDRQQPGRVSRIKNFCHLPEPAPSDLAY